MTGTAAPDTESSGVKVLENSPEEDWAIEEINPSGVRGPGVRGPGLRGHFRSAIFDFDGTISLIREGWQGIMIPYFTAELAACPGAARIPPGLLEEEVRNFIYVNTGKQTIYQCIELAERVKKLGGRARGALEYKKEYHRRLSRRIAGRIAELRENPGAAEKYLVPGSLAILGALKERGLPLYLASGTDEVYVTQEARLLGVEGYFDGIYGARDNYKSFSKKMLIRRIISGRGLRGEELLGFGDGYVEIENIKSAGGFACGLATDERRRRGVDRWKRNRLEASGADIIIPDFTGAGKLMDYLFPP
ncbi:MAG: haloacid dehalogenase-like hydrolase [Spirochaetaceae bacterium]|nr:haloacid dehalogenase-like hydrolase [Spirochaetaceae bacterium]